MTTDTQAIVLARIREIDRMDEEQIVLELAGDGVGDYVYQFPMDGKQIQGLSWAGYKELAYRRGNYVIEKPEVEDVGDHIRVLIRATDLQHNVTLWAGTHQPKMRRVKADGGGYSMKLDDFAFEKAISKAQRNVLKNLIPHGVVKLAIEAVLGGKAMPAGRPKREAPPQARIDQPKQREKQLPEGMPVEDVPVPQNLMDFLNSAIRFLGYKNKVEILAALQIDDEKLLGPDLSAPWQTLLEKKQSQVQEEVAELYA